MGSSRLHRARQAVARAVGGGHAQLDVSFFMGLLSYPASAPVPCLEATAGGGGGQWCQPVSTPRAGTPLSRVPAVPIRLVLAEDNYLLREGLRRLIDSQPESQLLAAREGTTRGARLTAGVIHMLSTR